MGARNIGPRDMFVARLERLALLAQANMDNAAINHETGPQQQGFERGPF